MLIWMLVLLVFENKGFNFVTIGADQRAMSAGAKAIVEKMKGSISKKESETY